LLTLTNGGRLGWKFRAAFKHRSEEVVWDGQKTLRGEGEDFILDDRYGIDSAISRLLPIIQKKKTEQYGAM
jgi:hypothetical protein